MITWTWVDHLADHLVDYLVSVRRHVLVKVTVMELLHCTKMLSAIFGGSVKYTIFFNGVIYAYFQVKIIKNIVQIIIGTLTDNLGLNLAQSIK